MLKKTLLSLIAGVVFVNVNAQVPAGYYDGAYNGGTAKTCADLKTSLFNIISNGTVTLPYNSSNSFDTWDAINQIDLRRNDANTRDIILDMYTDNPSGAETVEFTPVTDQCGQYQAIGDCYNREHSFPQSWFDENLPMLTDLHALFASDGYINGRHDNYPYGEVSSSGIDWSAAAGAKLGDCSFPGYTGTVFEPINEYKGDFARAMFYMVTRYQSNVGGGMSGFQGNGNANAVLDGTTWPSLDGWAIQQWYKWHVQDPVSAKEIARNNAIYTIQNNRNPFIDHPEFVALIWQCTNLLPVVLMDFTAAGNSALINLNWMVTGEANFKYYEVERSEDGVRYSAVCKVNGTQQSNYSFSDNRLPAAQVIYYRLRMVDVDGRYTYSKIVPVRLSVKGRVTIFPNPAKDVVTITLQKPLSSNSQIKITDATGRLVISRFAAAAQNNFNIAVNKLPAGRYIISIVNNDAVINESFVISK